MEELFVLLVRETARKIVHLVNFTTKNAAKIPRKIRSSAREFLHHILYLTDYLLKVSLINLSFKKCFSDATYELSPQLQYHYFIL